MLGALAAVQTFVTCLRGCWNPRKANMAGFGTDTIYTGSVLAPLTL